MFSEPYDVATWGMILVVAVHLTGFFILLYDFLGPAAKERYKGRSGQHKYVITLCMAVSVLFSTLSLRRRCRVCFDRQNCWLNVLDMCT